jgi:ubiquinone/menaquinone biosynthesis C-methylase UbiE
MLRAILAIAVGLPLSFALLHTIVRIVRAFYKFPIPEFLAGAIDHPLRRRYFQPPDETAIRHGLGPGMRVLDVGPGSGTYTLAAARRVGADGSVVAIDIEPKIIERVRRRAEEEGVTNLDARVADVYDLPFGDGEFDAIYLIAVIGEIPEPVRAISELSRVLSASGTLAFSEMVVDPDYPRAQTLTGWAEEAGVRLRKRVGSAWYYTLIFEKGPAN